MAQGALTGRRLLGVFAHPDDETYTFGGALARYTDDGAEATILTFTRGEAGQIGGGSDATPETLGAVREAELREACRILGVKDVRVVGTPDGDTHEAEEGIAAIVDAIEELRPDILVTMEPLGITRHPDHIAVSNMTLAAFERTREKGYPKRLYDTVEPAAMMSAFTHILAERGIPWISPDDPLYPQAAPDRSIGAIVELGDHLERKMDALWAHRTQNDEFVAWLPEDLRRFVFGAEVYQRVFPPKVPGVPPETDLFAGIGEDA